mgnify:CR=1 FL=1
MTIMVISGHSCKKNSLILKFLIKICSFPFNFHTLFMADFRPKNTIPQKKL